MSKALYRKYRSKSLNEVVGQDHVIKTLESALKSGQINHAYLFTGPRGVGKTSVARILAHNINDLPYDEEKPHLDIIEIDAASNRRIDDIRDLREKVHITPVSSKYKVYIIDEVHMLTGESFNALLKTLEEPPDHVIFILATTEFHKLPATIVSRTQRFHFKPIESKSVIGHLKTIAKKENIQIDDEALQLISDHGEGSFRDSISLLDQLSIANKKNVSLQHVEEALGLAPASSIGKIISLLESGDSEKLQSLLKKLETQGVSPVSLSVQLQRELFKYAQQNSEYYSLIDSLLDIGKSSKPDLKLSLILLQFQNRNKTAIPAASKPTLASENVTQIASVKPKDLKQKTNRLTPADWNDVLTEYKSAHPALFNVLRKAEPRFNEESLDLATNYKIYQKKLDETRFKDSLQKIVEKLGFSIPAIKSSYDKNAVPPDFVQKVKPIDKTTDNVLTVMGGGEVLDA